MSSFPYKVFKTGDLVWMPEGVNLYSWRITELGIVHFLRVFCCPIGGKIGVCVEQLDNLVVENKQWFNIEKYSVVKILNMENISTTVLVQTRDLWNLQEQKKNDDKNSRII